MMFQEGSGGRMMDRAKHAHGGHQPGHAYKRNFNRNPTGRFNVRMKRGHGSRSKSSRS